ncbi:MAG: hypothetical protein Q9160_000330 [Pyrenula sp. 1 TL-2023]
MGQLERTLNPSHSRKPSPLQSFSSTQAARLPTSASGSSQGNSASKWFNNVNENVHLGGAQTFDNDSPYYLGQRNASVSSDYVPNQDPSVYNQQKSPDSENEDLRSVIDDLTIKNKRLKRRIRNLQKSSLTPSANDSRLFEVRIHDLPGERKRELEAILRSFASKLNRVPEKDYKNDCGFKISNNASDTTITESSSLKAGTKKSNAQYSDPSMTITPMAVKTSAAAPSDSAYASMSQLGRSNSGTNSNNNSLHGGLGGPASNASKDKKIHSYLRDIPQSLLPQHNPIMSEGTKMRAVVRRLEQLFTGNTAAPGEHSLPLQQQAISDSAAQDDQAHALQSNRALPAEGSREARILPNGLGKVTDRDMHSMPRNQPSAEHSNGKRLEDDRVVDQRPTRPLDLDMHRAQDPADNLEYIRHLGLSYPHSGSFIDSEPSRWVYLNLLVNMAQLHMLNVTHEFIRKSVETLSIKLELSDDGRKLRWRGGVHGTTFSSESGSNTECQSESSPERSGHHFPGGQTQPLRNSGNLSESKMPSDSLQQSKTSDSDSMTGVTGQWSGKLNLQNTNPTTNPFEYKPVFLKQHSTDSDDSSDFPNEFSYSGGAADTTTVPADSGFISTSKPKSKSANEVRSQHGPIVFYSNVSWFIDLSEEHKSISRPKHSLSSSPQPIIGVPHKSTENDENTHGGAHGQSHPSPHLAATTFGYEHAQTNINLEPLGRSSGCEDPPFDFEASGIGGVTPSDNFVINVRTSHQRPRKSMPMQPTSLSTRQRRPKPNTHTDVLSLQHIKLPASALPPPSFIFPFSSNSTSNFGDLHESTFGEGGDGGITAVSTHRAPVVPNPAGRLGDLSDDDPVESDVSSDTDSEIDMLQHARALDPAAVRKQEQDFEAAHLKMLGMDLPPGSSAATAGGLESFAGSSNVTSPGSTSSEEDEDEDDGNNGSRTGSLKRRRTTTNTDTEPDIRVSKAPRIHIEQH